MKNDQYKWELLPDAVQECITEVIRELPYSEKVSNKIQVRMGRWFAKRLDKVDGESAVQVIKEFQQRQCQRMLKRFHRKYGRPSWWKMIKRVSAVLMVLTLLVGGFVWWFLSGEPVIRIDYAEKMNTLISEGIDPEDDALPYYLKAIELYSTPNKADRNLVSNAKRYGDFSTGFGQLSKGEQQQVEAYIRNNEKSWLAIDAKEKQQVLDGLADGVILQWPERGGDAGKSMSIRSSRGDELHKGVLDLRDVIFYKKDILATNVFGVAKSNDPNQVKERQWAHGVSVSLLREWIRQSNQKSLEHDIYGSAIKRILEENDQAWAMLAQGARKPYCCWQYEEKIINQSGIQFLSNTINLSTLKNFARYSRNRVWAQREAGDKLKAVQTSLDMIRLSHHLANDKTILIDQLVSISLSAIGMTELINVVDEEEFSADTLKKIQSDLGMIYKEGYPILGLEGEKISMHNIIQKLYTEGGPGGGHVIPSQYRKTFAYDGNVDIGSDMKCFWGTLRAPFRDEMVRHIDESFDALNADRANKPFLWDRSQPVEVQAEFDLLQDMSASAYLKALSMTYLAKASYEALVTRIALRRYQIEKGEYPATLEELVKTGYLSEVPDDPFGEGSLSYERRDDSFILGCNSPSATQLF